LYHVVVKSRAFLILVVLASGCARAPEQSRDPDEQQMRDTLEAAEKGPSTWSPAVTIPLYPVILVADTAIGFTKATYRFIHGILGGGPDEAPPVPERIEKQAEELPKN
jgi:hypothetical protein